MIMIFNVRTKVISLENMYKFCNNGSTFTWFLAWTNLQADRQTLNCRMTTLSTIVSPWKWDFFNKIKLWKSEHSLTKPRLKKRFWCGPVKNIIRSQFLVYGRRLCTVVDKKNATLVVIPTHIIVEKWNWYHSSWKSVLFKSM